MIFEEDGEGDPCGASFGYSTRIKVSYPHFWFLDLLCLLSELA